MEDDLKKMKTTSKKREKNGRRPQKRERENGRQPQAQFKKSNFIGCDMIVN